MDIHAYSQLWMMPWGYKRAYPEDNGEMVSTIKQMVDYKDVAIR